MRRRPHPTTNSSPERIQKLLAAAGLGSRRHVDALVGAGRVRVNGKVAVLGQKITPGVQVQVDGRRFRLEQGRSGRSASRILAYYKPEGEICSAADPQGRRSVFASLPRLQHSRWLSIGRLDLNSAGLLLFTDDGELAHKLMHPRSRLEREYAVRVSGKADAGQLAALLAGVRLDDGPARFTRIRDGGGKGRNHWYHVIIMEGRNREVRRLWASQGLQANRLIRVRYGPYRLPSDKRPGQHWMLQRQETEALMRDADTP